MGRLATRLNRGLSRVFGYEVVRSRASAQDSMMLAHHAAVGEACRRPLSYDLQARIVMLGLLMAPRRVTGHRKIRVGGRTDGGYVMLDDFSKLQTAFSLGVGPNVDWDPDYYLGDFRFGKATGRDNDALMARAGRTQAVVGFDAARYSEANPDVVDAGHDPWTHWSLWGWREGRPLSLDEVGFDGPAYLAANPDVLAAGVDALIHWRHFGRREGRPRFPRPGDRDAASAS